MQISSQLILLQPAAVCRQTVRRAVMVFSRQAVLLLSVFLPVSSFVLELDDLFMDSRDSEDIWLIKFYAPWCSVCKQLDPVWHELGSELRSLGSPVIVAKVDATVHTGLAKTFRIRSYPSIFMLKKEVKYKHDGARSKDAIMAFTNRVAGPLVRVSITPQLFQYAMSHNNVMIVYIGATSPLKGNYTSVAEELIIHTPFFSASREVLPQTVSLSSLPAVLILKDGTYLTYNEELDGELKSWINRERFLTYTKLDSYLLYSMGESGKLVALALVEEKNPSEDSLRCKALLEQVAEEYRELYSRYFHFGFIEGGNYMNGLIMGEVVLPSFIVVNLSNDGYFLPPADIQTERHLLNFLDGVLDSSVQSQGGNGLFQCLKRFVYEMKMTLTPVVLQASLLACFLLSVLIVVLVYLCCRATPSLCEDGGSSSLAAPPHQRKMKSNKKSN
ncbi:protein disulfide-isomerase tmx3a-like [Genypterus blacodes]|uniref:protein disulfide-isomerase tmx3a-like n=1 Tax=Genypterus blacodes TaxID=154954 RepID=UPI003F7639CC